jgi:hypothetical protein
VFYPPESIFSSHFERSTSFLHNLVRILGPPDADLQAKGVRCWFAPHDMKTGDKIRERIDQAIHLHEKLLLILSEHALASDWVEAEVEAALEKEQRQHRLVLFPIRIDDEVMHTTCAWAALLRRTRHVLDFTQWSDQYTISTPLNVYYLT